LVEICFKQVFFLVSKKDGERYSKLFEKTNDVFISGLPFAGFSEDPSS